MPNHTPEHIRSMAAESAAARRTARLAGLIATAPPLTKKQLASLQRLLDTAQVLPEGGTDR